MRGATTSAAGGGCSELWLAQQSKKPRISISPQVFSVTVSWGQTPYGCVTAVTDTFNSLYILLEFSGGLC